MKLPVIVGMGGINAAGRTSGFHNYKRMVHDVLSSEQLKDTWLDLAHRMKLELPKGQIPPEIIRLIQEGTLVRRIERFDPDHVYAHQRAKIQVQSNVSIELLVKKSKGAHDSTLTLDRELEVLVPTEMQLGVTSAGGLPSGFDPTKLYNAHHHPRGLAMTVYAMSDALNNLGIAWSDILKQVKPDAISVYAGSALGQIDENSIAGMVAEPLKGHRINSKMMAMSLAEMPADFVNSYVINSIGATGHNVGACATFLYNLKQGIQDIQSGRSRVAIIGCSEAPIVPEIIEGFRVMGALATDEALCHLDGATLVNNRRACRPFSSNAGFTLAESAQFFILMDDELALKLGATIYGSVADVFINADANKKSIASPGVGNYVTVAKAAAFARAILGDEGLEKTFVQAHGTGTPQNRVTESHILNETAKTFGLNAWPVAAIKSYLGHSVAVAAGDQLAASLGVWQYGWIPGIKTIDHIASDVHQSNLNILMDHLFVGEKGQDMRASILNSKGFGGNNASAVVLSPRETMEILKKRHGQDKINIHTKANEKVLEMAHGHDQQACEGKETIQYNFGQAVMQESDVTLTKTSIKLSAFENLIDLPKVNPYA